jgi:hypothetical protein
MERAMPYRGSSLSAHRIGILMSQTGRFLECIECRLSFTFPPGTRYDAIAKQFESHSCHSAGSAGHDSKKLGEN